MWGSPHKIPIVWGSENFQVSEHIHIVEVQCTPVPGGQKLLCLGPSQTLPIYLFIWLFIYIF